MSCHQNRHLQKHKQDILNRMEVIGQRSIQQLLQVDPTLIHEAWTDSMIRYSDDTCPPMEEYNGMDLWRESCTTENGNQFWAGHSIFVSITTSKTDTDGKSTIGLVDKPASFPMTLNYRIMVMSFMRSGTNPFGQRALHGLIFGNFAWNDDDCRQNLAGRQSQH